jgi:hypothetical protein
MAGGQKSNHMTGGPAQVKFAVTMAGSGPKSTQRKRLQYSANKLPCIDKGINNAIQEGSNNLQTWNKFNSSI